MDVGENWMEDGGGWGGDTSFATAGSSAHAQKEKNADKLYIPTTVSTLANLLVDAVTLGDVKFTSVMTIGDVVKGTNVDQSIQYVIADPDEPQDTFNVMNYNVTNQEGMGDSEMDEDDSLVRPHTRLVFCGKLVTAEGRASMVSYKVRPLLVPQEYDIFKKEAEVARFYYEKDIPQQLLSTDLHSLLAGAPFGPLENSKENMGKAANSNNFNRMASSDVTHLPPQGNRPIASSGASLGDKVISLLSLVREENSGKERQDASVTEILRRLGMKPDQEGVLRQTLDRLSSDGQIFPTIDTNFYELI